jgi:hypothetical protein
MEKRLTVYKRGSKEYSGEKNYIILPISVRTMAILCAKFFSKSISPGRTAQKKIARRRPVWGRNVYEKN